MADLKPALNWLNRNHEQLVKDLAQLVAIPSISTDGEHAKELDKSAELIQQQMQEAGLENVEILRQDDSYPYIYGEWLGAPGKPTLFLYAHHDVQPTNFMEQWESDPWKLTAKGGAVIQPGGCGR